MFSDIGRTETLLNDVHMICLNKKMKDLTGQIKISRCPTMFLGKQTEFHQILRVFLEG